MGVKHSLNLTLYSYASFVRNIWK